VCVCLCLARVVKHVRLPSHTHTHTHRASACKHMWLARQTVTNQSLTPSDGRLETSTTPALTRDMTPAR
jgi:hypothetical protein